MGPWLLLGVWLVVIFLVLAAYAALISAVMDLLDRIWPR